MVFRYIATELCNGSLEDFFNEKYDGLENIIISEDDILRQVTQGLAHLHKIGIVHRNIKPENILFVVSSSLNGFFPPELLMKLADFDITRILKTEERILIQKLV